MRYYPIHVDLFDKPVLVVGGGEVASRRVAGLLEAGAKIMVVSPQLTKYLQQLVQQKIIGHTPRVFKEVDLGGHQIVFAATSDKNVNKEIARLCRWRKLLCNVVSQSDLGDFVVPSRITRGDLILTISTDGKVPFLSRQIRLELEQYFGEETEVLIELLAQKRKDLLDDNKGYLVEKMSRMDLQPLREEIKKGGLLQASQWLDQYLNNTMSLNNAR